MTIEFRCLHGTLQTPEAWSVVSARLGPRLPEYSPVFRAEDVLAVGSDEGGPAGWARAYCASLPAAAPGVGRVLLGYSLGGRLGLHALLECPARWKAAVIVAAHPGDASPAERAKSARRDAAWAARLREDDLRTVLSDWDALPVFCGRPNPVPRPVARLSAERWATALARFSRGNQQDLRPALSGTALPPLLYVSGALDAHYGAVGDELARLVPGLRHTSIDGAGHRVPWERRDAFADAVATFLRFTLPGDPAGGGDGRRPS